MGKIDFFQVTTHSFRCFKFHVLINLRAALLTVIARSKYCVLTHSFCSKGFTLYILIFLLLGLPLAQPVRNTLQHKNWKGFSWIEKSYWELPPEMKNIILHESRKYYSKCWFSPILLIKSSPLFHNVNTVSRIVRRFDKFANFLHFISSPVDIVVVAH